MKYVSKVIFISIPDGQLFFDIVGICEYAISVHADIATLGNF